MNGLKTRYPKPLDDSSIKAGDRDRTYDTLITNQLLYQLSYTGAHSNLYDNCVCNHIMQALVIITEDEQRINKPEGAARPGT